jgi:prepilin-type N-terminal cleavage/methylation domain-containing protein
MRTKGGFTIIEVSFALIIIGIISVTVLMRLNSYSRYNSLEKEVWKIYKDFTSFRGKAMKSDCTIRVTFLSSSKFTLLTDFNNNGTKDASETIDTTKLPAAINFGLPSIQAPSIAPTGLTLPATGSFTTGDWKVRGIVIDSTATAVVNTGSIYISSPAIGKFTFCIAVNDSTQVFKMYKWNGASWIDLR